MTNSAFQNSLPFILPWEGGFVNLKMGIRTELMRAFLAVPGYLFDCPVLGEPR
jgi:hypothetical protein